MVRIDKVDRGGVDERGAVVAARVRHRLELKRKFLAAIMVDVCFVLRLLAFGFWFLWVFGSRHPLLAPAYPHYLGATHHQSNRMLPNTLDGFYPG